MNRKSIAQEYYILVTDKYGMLPAMNREEAGAGLAAAAFMELLAAGVIEEEKKKTVVVKDLPAELEYLRPLYIYLREKHRYANRIMTDWHSGSRCRQLMELIGRSLQEAGLAKEEEGGLFRPKQVYIPEKKYKEKLIGTLKARNYRGRRDDFSGYGAPVYFTGVQESESVLFERRETQIEKADEGVKAESSE